MRSWNPGLFILLVPALALAQDGNPGSTWREAIDAGRTRLAETCSGLQASAFGDVLAAPDEEGRKRLDWGSFELDLGGTLQERFDVAAAVVTNQTATRFTVAFLDYHPFGGTLAPRGRLSAEKGFHVQVGRFDVPFGNDWQFFANRDSVSISRPLTTEEIMDGGYNDMGLRVLGNNGTVNFNTYYLRGNAGGGLVGGRIGLTPFNNPFSLRTARDPKTAEVGVSYYYDAHSDGRKQEVAWAADAETRVGKWYLRAEYIRRDLEPQEGSGRITRSGWHLTQEYALANGSVPSTLFLRYERTGERPTESPQGDDHDKRLVGGLSLTLAGIFQLKAEWQRSLKATAATRDTPGYSRNQWLGQMVVVF